MPSSVEMDRDSSSSNRASGIVARPIPLNEGLCVVVARRRNFGFKARGVAEYQPSLKVINGLVQLYQLVRVVRSSRGSTEIESVAMKVLCHDPRGAYCSAARATSPEFTASKARPSLAHPAEKVRRRHLQKQFQQLILPRLGGPMGHLEASRQHASTRLYGR